MGSLPGTLLPAVRPAAMRSQCPGAPLLVKPCGSPSSALTPSEFKGLTSKASTAAFSSSSLCGTLLAPLPLLLLSPSIPPPGTRGVQGTQTCGVPGAGGFLGVSSPATATWVLPLVSCYSLQRTGIAREAPGGSIDNVKKFATKNHFGDQAPKATPGTEGEQEEASSPAELLSPAVEEHSFSSGNVTINDSYSRARNGPGDTSCEEGKWEEWEAEFLGLNVEPDTASTTIKSATPSTAIGTRRDYDQGRGVSAEGTKDTGVPAAYHWAAAARARATQRLGAREATDGEEGQQDSSSRSSSKRRSVKKRSSGSGKALGSSKAAGHQLGSKTKSTAASAAARQEGPGGLPWRVSRTRFTTSSPPESLRESPETAAGGTASRAQVLLQRMQQQRQESRGMRIRPGAEGTSTTTPSLREIPANEAAQQEARKGGEEGTVAWARAQSEDQVSAQSLAPAPAQAQVQLNRAITGAATLSDLLQLLDERARMAAATAPASKERPQKRSRVPEESGRTSSASPRPRVSSASSGSVTWNESTPLENGGHTWEWLSPFNAVTALHRVARHLEAQKVGPAMRADLVTEVGGVVPGLLGVARGALEQLLGEEEEEEREDGRLREVEEGTEGEKGEEEDLVDMLQVGEGAAAGAEGRGGGASVEDAEEGGREDFGEQGGWGREEEGAEAEEEEGEDEEETEVGEGEYEEEDEVGSPAGAAETSEAVDWRDVVAQWWAPSEDATSENTTRTSHESLGLNQNGAPESDYQSLVPISSAASQSPEKYLNGVVSPSRPSTHPRDPSTGDFRETSASATIDASKSLDNGREANRQPLNYGPTLADQPLNSGIKPSQLALASPVQDRRTPDSQSVAASQLPQMLANLAWALSKLATSSDALIPEFDLLQRALLAIGPPPSRRTKNASGSASVSLAGGTSGGVSVAVPTVVSGGVPVVHRLSPQHVANISAAYAKARNAAPSLMEAVAARATLLGPHRFSPQELSQTLWAFAVLGHPLPPPLLKALAQLSSGQEHSKGEAVPDSAVQTLPQLGQRVQLSLGQEYNRASTISVPLQEQEFGTRGTATGATGPSAAGEGFELGRFGAGGSSGVRTGPKAGLRRSTQARGLEAWSEQQLSNAAWACAVLEHLEEPFFGALWGELLSREALFQRQGQGQEQQHPSQSVPHNQQQQSRQGSRDKHHDSPRLSQDQQGNSQKLSHNPPQMHPQSQLQAGGTSPLAEQAPTSDCAQGDMAPQDLPQKRDPPQPTSEARGRLSMTAAAGVPRAGPRLRHLSQLHQVSISLLLLQRSSTASVAVASGGAHGGDIRATWLWEASRKAWRKEGEAARQSATRMSLCHKEVLQILSARAPNRGYTSAVPPRPTGTSAHAARERSSVGAPQVSSVKALPSPSSGRDVPIPELGSGSEVAGATEGAVFPWGLEGAGTGSGIQEARKGAVSPEDREGWGAGKVLAQGEGWSTVTGRDAVAQGEQWKSQAGNGAAQHGEEEEVWVVEHCGPDTFFYSLDLALPGARVAVEIDGPSHFTSNTDSPLGSTLLKRRHLQALGWSLAPVPFFEWQRLVSKEEKKAYIDELLRKLSNLA